MVSKQQFGQALVEANIVFLILILLGLAAFSVGRLQNQALQDQQTSRFAVFDYALKASNINTEKIDLHQQEKNFSNRSFHLKITPTHFLQAGGNSRTSTILRRDWEIEDHGVVTAQVGAQHTSLLTGAGHAINDANSQHRMMKSSIAWENASRKSMAIARQINTRVSPIDQAWGRPSLSTNWVQAWQDLIPEEHLSNSSTVLKPHFLLNMKRKK